MDIFHSLILGVVEGITEFLPVSSTGHLILTGQVMGLPETEFLKSFYIAIQLGAILSVVVLYWRALLLDMDVLKKVIAAFLPTAVIGLILYKLIKQYLLSNDLVVVWALLIGGILLIAFEAWHKEADGSIDEVKNISYKQAMLIGLFQSLAVVPGVSRSAATILGGLFLGLKRKTIVEFSFLLAIPTMAAATGLDLLKSAYSFSGQQFILLGVGFGVSFVVAILSIKFLLHFIKKNNFMVFGFYRIIVAVVFLLFR